MFKEAETAAKADEEARKKNNSFGDFALHRVDKATVSREVLAKGLHAAKKALRSLSKKIIKFRQGHTS